ncbi:E3 ubiquitin-protein ligase RAD18-like [Anneissia japonica]|uniref:E3 ubiquitin-protein ligase RAD18-like n=1 Tax=Anneissia japonica TaxID=1529436 RepID=UPI0014257432|nr:E3 ubiquitin-protein ligase RAD18-like [Anneissia japonica]
MENSTVNDPSDWPSTMTELRTIDNLLRCPICYEFLKTAMMIPECSHNFCSLCIRTYMAYKNQCPTCSISFLETNLKNNRVLDDVVKNFRIVRPHILQLCKNSENQKSVGMTTTTSTGSGSVCYRSSSAISKSEQIQSSKASLATDSHSKNKSTKVSLSKRSPSASKSSSDIDDPDFEPCSKSPRIRSNQTPKRRNLRAHFKPSASSTEEDEEDEVVCPTPVVSRQQQVGDGDPPILLIPSPPSTFNNNPTRASCPICGVSVLERFINTHLDKCLASQEKKDALRTKRRPLLKFVCNLMSDKDLRKKLKEYNVSHQGTRQVLIKRLKDFSLLYNSYCDSDNPKSVEAISKEFENIEKIKMKHSSDTVKDRLVVEKGKTDEEFDESRKKYLVSHKSQFQKMIEETRKRQLEMKSKASKSKAPSTDSTSASSSIGSLKEGENQQTEGQDKLVRTQDLSQTLSSSSQDTSQTLGSELSRTQDSSQTLSSSTEDTSQSLSSSTPDSSHILRTELVETQDSSQMVRSDFVRSWPVSDPQASDRGIVFPKLNVSPSTENARNYLGTLKDVHEADRKVLLWESLSDVSQNETDAAQSKTQLDSMPSTPQGEYYVPESPVFQAKVSRRSGIKRKDVNENPREDMENIRRSKRNKQDTQ